MNYRLPWWANAFFVIMIWLIFSVACYKEGKRISDNWWKAELQREYREWERAKALVPGDTKFIRPGQEIRIDSRNGTPIISRDWKSRKMEIGTRWYFVCENDGRMDDAAISRYVNSVDTSGAFEVDIRGRSYGDFDTLKNAKLQAERIISEQKICEPVLEVHSQQ